MFFAAACLVMVLAANYQALLADLHVVSREQDGFAPGDGWRSVIVGTVVAAVAYAGFLVILLPMYEFMAELFDRLGGRRSGSSDGASESSASSPSRSRRRRSKRSS